MNANEVIDAYVVDVMRRVPAKDRNEIGFELRGLLGDMLAEKATVEGRAVDDAMVLAMLREFGTPVEIAARYRSPGVVVIPAESTRSFALTALIGVALQWATSLSHVTDLASLGAWWTSWGLGAFWWPGFLVMIMLIVAGLRHLGWYTPTWRPRTVDPDRISRPAIGVGLIGIAIGVAIVASLPWVGPHMPGVLPQVFAFDPEFLRVRAWPVLVLWLASIALLVAVYVRGRWSPRLRQLEIVSSVAWIALLGWWLAAGNIFVSRETDEGAKAGIGLVILIIVFDLAYTLYRQRTRISPPKFAN